MSSDKPTDSVNDEIRKRARAGFEPPAIDRDVTERILAGVRARTAAPVGHSPSIRVTGLGAMALVAAVALGIFLLPGGRPGKPQPGPSVAAAVVLQRAVAAVTTAGATATGSATSASVGGVLHVVADTTYETPAGHPVGRKESNPAAHLGLQVAPDAKPRIVRVSSEHWLDEAGRSRHTLSTSAFSDSGDIWSNELLVANGTRTVVHAQKPSRGATSTFVTETDQGDWYTLGETSMADPQDQSPEQQIMDSANPLVYRSLLASGALTPPSHSQGWSVTTTATLLGTSEVDGVPVYRLRIDSASFLGKSLETSISLVADLRRSDYLPVRVTGRYLGETWTTVFRTVEWVAAADVPADAFRVVLAGTTPARSNHRFKPGTAAQSTGGAAVFWLGPEFEGLRFTGEFRIINNEDEYEVMAETGSAAVMADESRPRINARYVVAEYTPDAQPGNMTHKLTETTIKVRTMPRTDSSTWESAFATAAGGMVGDRNPPDWVMQTSWVTVGGQRALLMHHAFIFGDGSVSGRIHPTFDYLVFDLGDSTVMVQGACAKTGQVERAAAALIRAKQGPTPGT